MTQTIGAGSADAVFLVPLARVLSRFAQWTIDGASLGPLHQAATSKRPE